MAVATEQTVDYVLTVNTEMSYGELRKLEMSLMRIMYLVERFSGNQDLNKMLKYIQEAIVAMRSLQIAMRAVEMAEGPIGWLYAGVSIVAAATTIGTDVYDGCRGSQ